MDGNRQDLLSRSRAWLDLVAEDLRLARHAFGLASAAPYRLIAFHAQQCAEKSLKAVLVASGVDYPYTHNLARLIELAVAVEPALGTLHQAEALTPYAVAARYGLDDDPVNEQEARDAVDVAGSVLADATRALEARDESRAPEG